MTTKEFATRLNGTIYPDWLSKENKEIAKENGFIIVSGYSDDLIEIDGAIRNEMESFSSDKTFLLGEKGITACFCKKNENGKKIAVWSFETDIPHETFNIVEQGEVYCVGLIIDKKDLEKKKDSELESNTPLIKRKRYVVMRNNRTEIFCGLARNYMFKPVNDIGDTAIKTYLSEKKAKSSFFSSWSNAEKESYEIVPVWESITIATD